MRGHIVSLTVGGLIVSVLAGCSGSSCGSGAGSAVDAVTGLLDARSAGEETLDAAGEAGVLDVVEDEQRQMGAEHVVDEGGAFLVLVDLDPTAP